MLEKISAMRNSEAPLGASDYLIDNQHSPTLEQLNYKEKQRKFQSNFRKKIDDEEHNKADIELEKDILTLEITSESELNYFLFKKFPNNIKAKEIAQDFFKKQIIFGINISQKKLSQQILTKLENKEEISTTDKIKDFTESIRHGKSQSEILKILISKYEKEESTSTWVKNWRNFQKLNKFAENKPPRERRAIESIIANADLSSENAFATSLTEISNSSEISNESKMELSKQFSGVNVFSVSDLDFTLQEVKSHTTEIKNAINTKSREKIVLNSDIKNLESELEKLPLNDPKRNDLESEIEQKKESLENTETQISKLELAKPIDISFPLRNGFSAKLNDDGTRSIRINSQDFAIKLPSNFLPFTDLKNLRSINLAFPYQILKNQNIANIIFSPNLENNSVPTKRNRNMLHFILSNLKIDDSQILSENDILQLNKDLSRLTSVQNGKSPQDKLIDLGVFNIDSQSLDKVKFREILEFIRENRDLDNDLFYKKIETLSAKD